jgi:ATP synthase subunit D
MAVPKLTVPPGRAGRIWLVRRLATARRGAGLLDRKLRILQGELARRQAVAAEAEARWDQCQADAQACLLRAALLGGQRAITLADDGQRADVTIGYELAMGVRYPSRAACAFPSPLTWDGPVVARARQAHRAGRCGGARGRRGSPARCGRRGPGHPIPAPGRAGPVDPRPRAGAGRRHLRARRAGTQRRCAAPAGPLGPVLARSAVAHGGPPAC